MTLSTILVAVDNGTLVVISCHAVVVKLEKLDGFDCVVASVVIIAVSVGPSIVAVKAVVLTPELVKTVVVLAVAVGVVIVAALVVASGVTTAVVPTTVVVSCTKQNFERF